MAQAAARQHPAKRPHEQCADAHQAGDKTMMRVLVFSLILTTGSTIALADRQVSSAEAEKIQAALKAWGCSGGKMEQETEASGVFEVDDAQCHGGQYDIKLDKEFNVIVITRD
jgi:hypothetical protein